MNRLLANTKQPFNILRNKGALLTIERIHQRGLVKKSLYIGNISFQLQRDELEELVSKYGTIYSLRYPTDPLGRFKGIAFVSYEASVAEKVKQELDGAYIKGRNIRVNWAKNQPDENSEIEAEDNEKPATMVLDKAIEEAEEKDLDLNNVKNNENKE